MPEKFLPVNTPNDPTNANWQIKTDGEFVALKQYNSHPDRVKSSGLQELETIWISEQIIIHLSWLSETKSIISPIFTFNAAHILFNTVSA